MHSILEFSNAQLIRYNFNIIPMKKILLALILVLGFNTLKANDLNDNLIQLAKIYRNFMFRNTPNDYTFEQLDNIKSDQQLTGTADFIKETISTNNRLLQDSFLKIPEEKSLKFIYMVRQINWNLSEETPKDNNSLISELNKKTISRYELIDCYYEILFSGVGNKNQPFNLSNVNFTPDKYNLTDDTEKGIFFLKAMDLCGTQIWGYMNIVNPPNYKKALESIRLYPKFNGQPYYQYIDFSFNDFNMVIERDKEETSYKTYYINKYYDTLLYHMMCLGKKKKYKEERLNLGLGSILKEENYYKYSTKKSILESMFQKVNK